MTKFERAKAQTIEHWKEYLYSFFGDGDLFGDCGFCVEYQDGLCCDDCPVAWANDGMDCSTIEEMARMFMYCGSEDIEISNTLAILTYIHSLTEEGCIRPETK